MAYCGQFGCSCCSTNCRKCGEMKWRHELNDERICNECILEEKVEQLENKLVKMRSIINRVTKRLKAEIQK